MTAPRDIVLIGAGREASAAAHYFAGAPLFVFDDNAEKAATFAKTHEAAALDGAGVSQRTNALFLRAPGMAPRHELLAALIRAQCEVTTYLGYWLASHRAAVLATITGSKGKSTTTALCAAILEHAGLNVRAGGNIGVVPEGPPQAERWVFETSSYQLHDIPAAAPVHALTTLYPEHLDWHGGFDNYLNAKLRPLVIDPACQGVIPRNLASRLTHLPNELHFADDIVSVKDGLLTVLHGGTEVRTTLSASAIERLGNPLLAHNFAIALATAIVASGAPLNDLCRAADNAVATWNGLPSRQNLIGEFAARLWIDDALATIPQATMAALQRWPDRAVRLIMGGRNREQDFTAMIDYVNARPDVSVYAYGDSTARFAASLRRASVCQSLDEALAAAFADSKPGEVMLFSPAGATSEPGFTYQDRARRFADFAKAQALKVGDNG